MAARDAPIDDPIDRETVEALADRDDEYGAIARVVLSVLDGEPPSAVDCEVAGCPDLATVTRDITDGDGR